MSDSLDFGEQQVLLVDSSGNLRSTVKNMLQSMGFSQVTTTSTSAQVLEEIAESDYDIILIGHNVHDNYSGLQLLEEARYKGLIKPTCSWVLMTSDASQQAVLFAIEIQPDELLTKPFTLDMLRRRIEQLCRRRALLAPIERAIERKAVNRAVTLCDTLFKPSDPVFPQAQLIKGRLLLDQGKYQEAKAVFESLYWSGEGLLQGYQLAESHFYLGEFESAEKLLLQLTEKHPLLIPAYDLLARVYEASGDHERAQQQLKAAVAQSPLSIQRQMELGRLSIRSRDIGEAERAYRRCIHLGETSCLDSAAPYLKLANVQRIQMESRSGTERQDTLLEIERLLERAGQRFQRDPQLVIQTQLMQAKVYESLADADAAQQCYERALQHAEDHGVEVDLDQMRAQLLDETRPALPQPAQEVTADKPESKLDPAMSAKVNRIGVRNYLAEKPGQAIRYFGLAFEYDPGNARALLNLSQLFLEAARDTPSRREQRMKMHERYIRLAQRLPLAGEEKQRLEMLRRLAAQPLEEIPDGPLAGLLK